MDRQRSVGFEAQDTPIKGGEDAETNELPFCIESEITSEERRRERMRMIKEMQTVFF
jgi:hypothetical protein